MSNDTWIPEPSEASRPFFEGAQAGKLRLQCCSACGTWMFPVATMCSQCGGRELEWRDTSGQATLFAHGRLRREYHPRHQDRLPLILAQVDIAEGLRINTNLIDADPDTVRSGCRVEATFETFADGGVLPVFKPVDG
ncbi:MAG: zinc ribbon domain-containing protein [Pseudomonadota bacterium]